MLPRAVPLALLVLFALVPAAAHAEFAEPPPGEVVLQTSDDRPPEPWVVGRLNAGSVVRMHVGPALDVVHGDPGLHVALDVGRSAGFRAAGSFVALGTDGGVALYSGELWLCPLEIGVLRPVVAAGAGFRNVSRKGDDATRHEHAGVALLRGGLEVLLPTRDVESRAAVSVAGYLPAIVSRASPDREASVLLTGSLAIGF